MRRPANIDRHESGREGLPHEFATEGTPAAGTELRAELIDPDCLNCRLRGNVRRDPRPVGYSET
jgi:hypothetical protein